MAVVYVVVVVQLTSVAVTIEQMEVPQEYAEVLAIRHLDSDLYSLQDNDNEDYPSVVFELSSLSLTL